MFSRRIKEQATSINYSDHYFSDLIDIIVNVKLQRNYIIDESNFKYFNLYKIHNMLELIKPIKISKSTDLTQPHQFYKFNLKGLWHLHFIEEAHYKGHLPCY